MKKFINAVDDVLTESFRGFAAAHQDLVTPTSIQPTYYARASHPKKWHCPGRQRPRTLHAGFVGYGMFDAACPGQVFTFPPDQIALPRRQPTPVPVFSSS
jgi:dihydroxyacetone kinase-like protein